jgi:hypothetical protein
MVGREVNLYRLRLIHAPLFHPHQDWFAAEPFMLDPMAHELATAPVGRACAGILPTADEAATLPRAVDLAATYVMDSRNPIWQDYFWTSTVDRHGQRVYVGGARNGLGFEIHRHIHITERFGVPVFG